MQAVSPTFADLSDADLLVRVTRLAATERQATVHLIAALVELDARRLYLGEGCSSLFTYCTQVLHLSEHAAYGRIEAARAARRFPTILDRLADGSITLTTVTLLAPHLTSSNYEAVLDAARFKSKREVELQVASLHPRPDVPASIRKLQTPIAAAVASPTLCIPPPVPNASESEGTPSQPSQPESHDQPSVDAGYAAASRPTKALIPQAQIRHSLIEPLAPERYKIQITVGAETIEKLHSAQDLLRHRLPDGDLAEIIDRALTLLLEHLARTKVAATDRPRPSRPARSRSRYIPAAVRREVWARDKGRCTFVGAEGRCTERGFLEFHHRDPYALGGEATVETIALRCRAHNVFEAEQEFGLRPDTYRRSSTRSGPSSATGA